MDIVKMAWIFIDNMTYENNIKYCSYPMMMNISVDIK